MLPVPFLVAVVVFAAITSFLVATRGLERGRSSRQALWLAAEVWTIAAVWLGVVWLSAARFRAAQAYVEVDEFGRRGFGLAAAYVAEALRTVWWTLGEMDRVIVVLGLVFSLVLISHLRKGVRRPEG